MCELFNCKIIQYANGVVEVRKYNKVINEHLMYVSEDEMHRLQMDGIARSKDDICEPEEVYNPFENKVEPIISFEQIALLESRAERSARNSLNRTKNAIYKYARQCKWDYFVTLTYDSKKVDRYDFSKCMSKACKWFENQHTRNAVDLKYLFVPEQHNDGAWHVHGLIADADGMSFTDSGKRYGIKTIYNLDGWRYGFSTAVEIDDTFKVSSYITKYITKELCAVTKGRKRYYRSRNIAEPIETNVLLEPHEVDNYIDMVMDSIGVDLDFVKTVNGFVNVDYKYFKVKE